MSFTRAVYHLVTTTDSDLPEGRGAFARFDKAPTRMTRPPPVRLTGHSPKVRTQ